MNLILLFESDFLAPDRVRLTGRRLAHVTSVHRAAVGDTLVVGLAGGLLGSGVVTSLDPLELRVTLDRQPPPPLPLTLILALPRPKVLNRVIAGATSLGVKQIHLINAWRVEKSYWKSPRLASLEEQCILGLEQARDTILPTITLHRLFRPFIESFAPSGRPLVAHPLASLACPRSVHGEVTLAIGPEGGFIAQEIDSFQRAGFTPVSLGPRILRVETAVPALLSRLF
ncbi:MAG TPA: 16S rRNA (uracil(1498)-N(3))-methyltransferase [Thermoanaerobaculia bacterium]|nr:16S rRNA (uracil(1498)-N(3))-methyltransferase [Thermoanaerobaculia bacterium]